jgi:hypothetical protein
MINYTYNEEQRPLFEKVYDLLIEYGGASTDSYDKEAFVLAFTQREQRATEYRFCGHFGFGGKFCSRAGSFYIMYYPEDKTSERERLLAKINAMLATIEPRSPRHTPQG